MGRKCAIKTALTLDEARESGLKDSNGDELEDTDVDSDDSMEISTDKAPKKKKRYDDKKWNPVEGDESDHPEVGNDGYRDIATAKAPKKRYEDKRYRKWCPVDGYTSTIAHYKLTQHIQNQHPEIPKEERIRISKEQPRVPKSEGIKKRVPVPRGQKTLTTFLLPKPPHSEDHSPKEPEKPSTALPLEAPEAGGSKRGSTRSFPRLNVDSQLGIVRFREFLESIDGKLKSPTIAKAIATDVSKYLRFATPTTAATPDWATTYNRQLVLAYLEKMKVSAGCSYESQLSQLESLNHALRYVQCRLLEQNDPANNSISRVEKDMVGWKASLRKKDGPEGS